MLAVCLAVVLLLPDRLSQTDPVSQKAEPPPEDRPNIVLVLVDDLDARTSSKLPGIAEILAEEGTSFSRAFVSYPLCCPSRATILRGQYPHNHHVISTRLPYGGHEKFRRLESSTVATWLDDAGYRTALIGKYMNSYDTTGIPPGWDDWHALMGNFYNDSYRMNENGTENNYPSPAHNNTDVLKKKAVDFVSRASITPQPFFLYLAPNAPHDPPPVAPRHEDRFSKMPLPDYPSLNEKDLSDKPRWVQRRKIPTTQNLRYSRKLYRDRLRSMLSAEDMMRALISELERTGELENTYIFFTSDNGFHLGEHQLGTGKRTPYEEDIRVPLIVRGPGVPEGETLPHLTVNTDLAPTSADLAGAKTPSFVDGRSLAPLLSGNPTPPQDWRSAVLVESWWEGTLAGKEGPIPTYQVLRTSTTSYTEYATGEREFYDLQEDPYQLENRYHTANPVLLASLQERLVALTECAGDTCRAAENAPSTEKTGP